VGGEAGVGLPDLPPLPFEEDEDFQPLVFLYVHFFVFMPPASGTAFISKCLLFLSSSPHRSIR
jgi:hypothetical protein